MCKSLCHRSIGLNAVFIIIIIILYQFHFMCRKIYVKEGCSLATCFNGSQLAKLKNYIPYMSLPYIYRVEAQKVQIILLKNIIFVKIWNLRQFWKKLRFCQWLLNYISNLEILLHICDTYNCDYLPHTTFSSTQSIFSYTQISLPDFTYFTAKSPGVTQRSGSQESAFKKSKYPSAFFSQNYRLK